MSVHIHTTVPRKTDDMLEQLAKTYGSKSRVIEQAIETLLRVDKVGSCDDCSVKTKAREQVNLRETLDLMSIRRQTIDGLLEVAIYDKTIQDFIAEQEAEAKSATEVLKGSVTWERPSSFKEFLLIMEEVKNLTRTIEIPSYNDIDNTLVLRPKIFKKLPELVALQVATILEGLLLSFEIKVVGENIVVRMLRQDLFPIRGKEHREALIEQVSSRLSSSRPGLFRNTLMLVGPAFMNWAEKHLEEPIADFGSFLEDIKLFRGAEELPKEPKEFVRSLLSVFLRMNWFVQARIVREVDDETLEISFQSTTPSVAKLSVVMLSVILATRGWRLEKFSSEQTTVDLSIHYVGPEDQSLLDQIAEISLFQTIGKQFLDIVPIPREVLSSFASRVYDSDKQRFEEIYSDMGIRVASAIRIMARNNPEKARKLAQIFIQKNIAFIQPDAEIRVVDEEHFTVIFKKIDSLVISSQRILIESMFKELNYEASTTAFQNLLSFKLNYVEKPVLETLPRKRLMQSVIKEMSADSIDDAFAIVKETIDKTFPQDYPWTIRETGNRIIDMCNEMGIEVGIEYFEGGFTLKYKTCPYYALVKENRKEWLCSLRKQTLEYIISRVSHGREGRIKIIKSLLKNEHPCEYAIFLSGFLERDGRAR